MSETTCDARKNFFMLLPRHAIPTKPPLIFSFAAYLHSAHIFQFPEYDLFEQKNLQLKITFLYLGPFPLMLIYLINELLIFCGS